MAIVCSPDSMDVKKINNYQDDIACFISNNCIALMFAIYFSLSINFEPFLFSAIERMKFKAFELFLWEEMVLIFHRPLCLLILWGLISVWNYSTYANYASIFFGKLLRNFIKLGKTLCEDDEMISTYYHISSHFIFGQSLMYSKGCTLLGQIEGKRKTKLFFLAFLVVNNEILFFIHFHVYGVVHKWYLSLKRLFVGKVKKGGMQNRFEENL